MSRWFTFCAVAAVAIGHLDILIALGCGAAVVWIGQRWQRRRGAVG